MKIAIFGGTGLLGSNLLKLYSQYDVKSFSRRNQNNISPQNNIIINFDDLSNELSVRFDNWKPDIIINTIAIVSLQKCQDNYEEALNVNCNIAVKLSKVAHKYRSYFIHISTDHFYDDNLQVHNELQNVTIKNNYAKTKYEAEKKISRLFSNAIIVRTNIIGFRRGPYKSFFEWLIHSLKHHEPINLYTNYYTSPIDIHTLGKILIKCYKQELSGTYNIASSNVIDKYNFGLKVAKKFGFSSNNITASEIKNSNQCDVQRALTLGLDVRKVERILKIKMPTVDQTIQTLLNEYKGFNESE